MIEIGRLNNARAALAFVDYAKGLHIACRMQQVENEIFIFITDPTQEQLARAEYTAFVKDPFNPKYSEASWDNGDANIQLNYGSSESFLAQIKAGAGPLTLGVMLVCIIIFVLMNIDGQKWITSHLIFFNESQQFNLAEFWRVFTPSLLHFSALHIIFNLLWWWYLGGKIEKRMGYMPLLTLLMAAGTLPNILQFYISGPYFGGLSGIVYALASYSWVLGKYSPEKGVTLPSTYMGFMLFWLALGYTDVIDFTANSVHLGGLVVGCLLGWIDSKRPSITR